jgi:hypothetical protein
MKAPAAHLSPVPLNCIMHILIHVNCPKREGEKTKKLFGKEDMIRFSSDISETLCGEFEN